MSAYSKIFGPEAIGLLDGNDELTPAAREAFVAQVILLLVGGNKDGKGPKLSSIVGIPLPPIPGPKFPDTDRLLSGQTDLLGDLFWFDPSPLATVMIPNLLDPEKDYQKIIVNNLYTPLVKLLNSEGATPLTLIFDPTGFLDINLKVPDIPDFLAELQIQTPPLVLIDKFDLKPDIKGLAGLLPSLKAGVSFPSLPPIPIPEYDFIIFADLLLGILKIPIDIIPKLAIPDLEMLKPDFPLSLFTKVLELVLDILLKLLEELGLLLILPKLLIATLVIIMQQMVAMLVVLILAKSIGSGEVTKLAATLFGLIA